MKFTKSKIRRSTKKYNRRKAKQTYKRKSKPIVKAIQYANGLSVLNHIKPRPHFFRRSVINAFQLVNPITTSDVILLRTFTLADVPNAAEFQALFMQYKLCKVKLTFKYDKAVTTNGTHPVLYAWKNNDTDLIAGGINANYVAQQANVKRYQFSDENREFSMSIYPFWLDRIYQGSAGASGYTNMTGKSSQYIDINYPTVPHWGVNMFIPSAIGGVTTLWNINVDIEYQFKFREQQ